MRQATPPVSSELAAELRSIDDEREATYAALAAANRAGLTGAAVADVMARFDAVAERVERLKREHFPHYRGRLVVALGNAFLVSPTGRSSRHLWTRTAAPGAL